MNDFRIPVGAVVEQIIDVVTDVFGAVFDLIRTVFLGIYNSVDSALSGPPFWAIIIVAAGIALLAKGWLFAGGTAVGLLLIAGMNQWENAMDTLALVIVASAITVLLAIPLGILAARSNVASAIMRPVLDFMQTMPAFVYLIPALVLFRVGVVPGLVATVIFALAPGVRLTELGIRGVDREVVEAGLAFGSTPFRVLRQIQLPLALPTIMAGVNQIIMLALSMVVIAGMVGAGGLGGEVVASLNRIDIALGFEAGIAVVILAIFLDRLTGSFGKKRGYFSSIAAALRTRRREAASRLAVAA